MEFIIESFKYGIGPAIVIVTYLIISKIIDYIKDREKNKKRIEVNNSILECFEKLNSFLTYITKDIIEKENDKCIHAIRTSFRTFSSAIVRYSVNCIINNNIELNRPNIIDGLEHLINSEFTLLYNNLHLYTTNEKPISTYIKEEWKEELKLDIINIIFNVSLSKEQRIATLINKTNIRIKDYSSEVKKHYIEDGQSDY